VYPCAVHTRFEHSLGTCAMAHRVVASLRSAGVRVEPEEERLVGVAALLHDITHIPFGHTLEDERTVFARHDAGPRLGWLLSGGLGRLLEREGLLDGVLSLLSPGPDRRAPAPWLAEVVAGPIDADLLDYLRRDAYFTGLSQDYDDRLFRTLTVADGHLAVQLVKGGVERPDARSEVLQLLRLRYFLTERVYYHHAKVASGAMVAKAVEMALAGGFRERDALWLSDGALLEQLTRHGDRRVARLAAAVQRRSLFKRGYVLSPRSVPPEERRRLVARLRGSPESRRETEAELAAALGLEEGGAIIACLGETAMREATAMAVTADGLRRLNEPERPGGEAPLDVRLLEAQYRGLWRLYVFVPDGYQDRCASAAAACFGFPSERNPDGSPTPPR
ncbi:MAG: HD domain-containing protein, partial [Clostridia bacterium]|nr:HD domain-containing protein [Clostridia bacterium]